MKLLAIDTATENCSAALLIDGRALQREIELDRGHAQRILSMVDELLAEGGTTLTALDAIAFGRGPGAFTGVRLAASVTQGLAFGAGVGVVPVSDLRAVAQRALSDNANVTRVLVCNDARMHEVYWGCFERGPDGLAVQVGEERVGKPETVRLPEAWRAFPQPAATDPAEIVATDPTTIAGTDPTAVPPRQPFATSGPAAAGPIAGAGRGFAAYPVLRTSFASTLSVFQDRLLPRATEIAQLAAREVRAGGMLPPESAIPVYLRDDVAHVRTPSGSAR